MKYKNIAWCKDEKTNSDKVWGVILLAEDVPTSNAWHFESNKYVTFWGRRGAKLQTKQWNGSDYDAIRLFRKKLNKGYQSIEKDGLAEVYPEFQSDLEKTAFWATLKM
jgi:predicted DNA-binding WGR domain protein